jgi:hypothetical protein
MTRICKSRAGATWTRGEWINAVSAPGWPDWLGTRADFAQSEWAHVLAFSALVLALAGGSAALGRALSGARSVRCLTLTLIAAGALAAVTNIV